MEWISAKERLPENNDENVVIDDMNLLNIAYFNKEQNKWIETTSPCYSPINVTYWIPLPKQPKE
ncbi:MAG: DUF551 domain-containing protein [Methanobacterium sp.]